MIGRLIKSYRVYDQVGQSNVATVYLARDTLRNEVVAVKVIRPGLLTGQEAVQRFLYQAGMLTGLDCSHVARVLDHGLESGLAFIVMDYAEGKTLSGILEEQGPLELEWSLNIIRQTVKCLADAHEKGIVHSNLSPANIMITDEDKAMITGFDVLGSSRLSNPYYLAPESSQGVRASIQADIYALGTTLFQMLSGHVPYDGRDAEEIEAKHREAPIPSVREFKADVPAAVDELIRRCLAKKPEERFQEPLALLEAFDEALTGSKAQPALIHRRLGQYYLLEPVGEGGMATVYMAYQPSLDRSVAVKVLSPYLAHDPDFSARFEREAKAIAKLEYPHILPVYDFGQEDDIAYIVMRYIKGGTTLRDVMKGPLDVRAAVSIIAQMGRALDYAHRRGVVHLDVKPTNILLDEEGWALLSDFGLSIVMQRSARLMIRTGVRMGTPKYMSPEQGQGLALDGRSDIYSLGVVLYEMVTGRVPFDGETPLDVIEKHIRHSPLPPRKVVPDVPEDVEKVILKALTKDPAERYRSMADMVAALEGTAVCVPWLRVPLIKERGEKTEGLRSKEVTVPWPGKR
ncbi:MAG: protein kinase [Anaerolineae bacterium]